MPMRYRTYTIILSSYIQKFAIFAQDISSYLQYYHSSLNTCNYLLFGSLFAISVTTNAFNQFVNEAILAISVPTKAFNKVSMALYSDTLVSYGTGNTTKALGQCI